MRSTRLTGTSPRLLRPRSSPRMRAGFRRLVVIGCVVFLFPREFNSEVHDVRDEERVDVDMRPMSNNWSGPWPTVNSRQNYCVTRSKER